MRNKGLFLVCFIASFSLRAQEDNCKIMLREAVRKMKGADGAGYHMDYTITTVFTGEDGKDSFTAQAEITVTTEKAVYKSREIDIYKDARHMVSINKEEKVIYISNAVTSSWKKIQAEAFSILNDTLLNKFKVVACETSCPEKVDDHFVSKVRVSLPDAYTKMLGISSITYWIQHDNGQVVRCEMLYQNHPMGILSVDFVIKDYMAGYRGIAYEGDALSKVMSKGKNPLGKYKDYNIKDIR